MNKRTFSCRLFAVLVMTAAMGLLAACGGGSADPAELTPGPPSVDLHIVAKGLKFDQRVLSVPANSQVSLTLSNKDATPHNVSLYSDKSAKEAIFKGDLVSSRETQTYAFRTPAAGAYYFRCDVHPDMNGTLFVQ